MYLYIIHMYICILRGLQKVLKSLQCALFWLINFLFVNRECSTLNTYVSEWKSHIASYSVNTLLNKDESYTLSSCYNDFTMLEILVLKSFLRKS